MLGKWRWLDDSWYYSGSDTTTRNDNNWLFFDFHTIYLFTELHCSQWMPYGYIVFNKIVSIKYCDMDVHCIRPLFHFVEPSLYFTWIIIVMRRHQLWFNRIDLYLDLIQSTCYSCSQCTDHLPTTCTFYALFQWQVTVVAYSPIVFCTLCYLYLYLYQLQNEPSHVTSYFVLQVLCIRSTLLYSILYIRCMYNSIYSFICKVCWCNSDCS